MCGKENYLNHFSSKHINKIISAFSFLKMYLLYIKVEIIAKLLVTRLAYHHRPILKATTVLDSDDKL